MNTNRDIALAALVSIHGLGTDRIIAAAQHGCPAWIESKDAYCHRPATVGLLCTRHDTAARKRADGLAARESARREAERVSAVESLPKLRTELAALGTYLPEDLTEEQFGKTLKAAEHACERAWEEGRDRTANFALIRRQHIIREDQTND